jgi:hypothetical protein
LSLGYGPSGISLRILCRFPSTTSRLALRGGYCGAVARLFTSLRRSLLAGRVGNRILSKEPHRRGVKGYIACAAAHGTRIIGGGRAAGQAALNGKGRGFGASPYHLCPSVGASLAASPKSWSAAKPPMTALLPGPAEHLGGRQCAARFVEWDGVLAILDDRLDQAGIGDRGCAALNG